MSIFLGSRYAVGEVDTLPDRDRVLHLTVFRSTPQAFRTESTYLVRQGDRPDSIAENLLGSPSLWWAIADANKDLLLADPLTPGTVLRIPDVSDLD